MRRTSPTPADQPTGKDPLKPIETVVTAVLAFTAAITLVSIGATIFGSGSIMSFGEDQVCATSGVGTDVDLRPLPDGVSAYARHTELCQAHPGAGLRLLDTLHQLPSAVLGIAAFVLIEVLVRRARRRGLFTLTTVQALRGLGWLLAVGPIVATVLASIAQARLVHHLFPDAGSSPLDYVSPNWAVVVAGIGVITMARVLRQTVPMREELEATV